ncbi:hypothetical protein ARMGADRAFT_1121388 [Armillaria gallica]|uniref:Uncharacterized protein n=1 Tax=Armillaria gallica TaxID=47427 RepID=A0A2H3CXM5_ARMGA|nr:hypothetical protein ARMGADRAFT_1121388 [Armillaria gallica]
MYKECQKKYVYDQTHGTDQCSPKKPQGNQKQITATSSNKNTAGGMTSFSTGKSAGDNKGHDSVGKWMTYGGAEKLMDIDRWKYMSEGRCFTCHETEHISRDLLGTCQIDEGNLHKQRSTECVGFGKAISNVTLEPKP